MRDYIALGPTPAGEECEQVGPDYDPVQARKESAIFIKQLRRVNGPEPEGARLAQKVFAHDFGSYNEVVCYFDDTYQAAIDYAFKCEANYPECWDKIAKEELENVLRWTL